MDLLRDAGCEVSIYERSSDEIAAFSTFEKAKLPCRVVWSREDQNDLGAFLERTAPEIVHVHNTFPLISPAVFSEVAARRLPVVATLHNFRTTCVNAQLFRDGEPCELCVGRGPWRGVLHRCYRRSAAASMPLAASIAFHRLRGTWTYDVSRFIALAQFARDRFVTSGIPGDRIDVIPNFVPRPAERRKGPGDYFLFLGRITVEKGLDLLGLFVVARDGTAGGSRRWSVPRLCPEGFRAKRRLRDVPWRSTSRSKHGDPDEGPCPYRSVTGVRGVAHGRRRGLRSGGSGDWSTPRRLCRVHRGRPNRSVVHAGGRWAPE